MSPPASVTSREGFEDLKVFGAFRAQNRDYGIKTLGTYMRAVLTFGADLKDHGTQHYKP